MKINIIKQIQIKMNKRFTLLLSCFLIFSMCRSQNTQAHISIGDCNLNFTCYIENNEAFARCYSITQRYYGTYVHSVEFPEYVTVSGIDYKVIEIGNQACDAERICELRLENVILPNTIEIIGDLAFRKCWCKSISFPESLKTIGEYAFQQSHLSFIELPQGIQSIGSGAFKKCNLDTVIIHNSATFGQEVFAENSTLRTIIYTSPQAPQNWTAVNTTYVPDLTEYTSPSSYLGIYHIKEMISWRQTEFDYSGEVHIPQYTNNVDGYTETLDFSRLHKEAGSWCDTIFAHFKDNNNGHDFSVRIPYRYTIKPLNLTAKVDNVSREYGEENPTFTCSYTGFVNGENEAVIVTDPIVSTTATKTSDVGEYSITASGGSAKNYTIVYEPGTLTITKAPLTAKVNNETRQYGHNNPAFTISYTGLKNGEKVPKWEKALKIETSATKTSDVGTYDVTATGTPTNYSLSAIDKGILTITQAPLTINAENATRKYFEADPSFTYFCIGFLNDDNVDVLSKAPSFSTDATKTSNVGTYSITPSGAEAKNYAMSYKQGVLTITKRQLKATSNCSRFYGEENPLLPIEYDGFVNSETEEVLSVKPVGITTATKTSSVGEYPISVSGGEATNYDFVYEQGVLTITKAYLSAKVNDTTKVYGTQNPIFTIEYYGLKNGETAPVWTTSPTFQTEATKASDVGQYAIKAVNGVPVNYDIEIADGTLSVTPASLTIKAIDATRLYYSDDPFFSYKCNGFVNGDDENVLSSTPTLSTAATRESNVGTYEIKVGEASCSNYSISYINGTLTITPCTLMASVGNYERIYNEENPVFEVKYDGFVGNEDESVLNTKATANTTATKTSDVGTYKINVSGGSANNYTFSYIPGILTINKAEQTIVWEQDLEELKVSDQIELKATASSGLTVTYTSDNSSIAEVYAVGNKYYLDCKAVGELWLVAVQDGNQNYYSSPRIRKNIVIGDASAINTNSQTIPRIEKTSYGIRVIDANLGDIVRVYTFDGLLHNSAIVDCQTIDVPLTKHDVYIVIVGEKTIKIGY